VRSASLKRCGTYPRSTVAYVLRPSSWINTIYGYRVRRAPGIFPRRTRSWSIRVVCPLPIFSDASSRPNHSKPGKASVPEEVETPPAVGGHRPAALDVDLGPLTVKLRLGRVPGILELGRVTKDLGEHRGDEGHWTCYCTAPRRAISGHPGGHHD
jgi:hypothetical protein